MGLGNRSLPSRAASADPDVTFPVVTVSGCHSLMLAVDRPGGHLFPGLASLDFFASATAHRLCFYPPPSPLPCWKVKSILWTFCQSVPPLLLSRSALVASGVR